NPQSQSVPAIFARLNPVRWSGALARRGVSRRVVVGIEPLRSARPVRRYFEFRFILQISSMSRSGDRSARSSDPPARTENVSLMRIWSGGFALEFRQREIGL